MTITVSTVAKIALTCPRDGKEVILHKDCFECDFYKHFGLQGAHIMVTCEPDMISINA